MRRVWALAAVLAFAACGTAGSGGATPAPSGPPLTQPQLKYRLLDDLGALAYCDPDFYPIARADEASLAKGHEADMRADPETWAALSARHPIIQIAIYPPPPLTGEQLLPLYRDWKMLRAIVLVPAAAGFTFAQRFYPPGNPSGTKGGAVAIEGTIDPYGRIAVSKRTTNVFVNCPICLARGTRIATPSGDVAVEDLTVGMAVWTARADGTRVPAMVREVGSAGVPADHAVVDLRLGDGRRVLVSPGHPTIDGRRVGDLRPGDAYDGSTVASAGLVAYGGTATFDLLPSGPTGTYWADGVALGSSLR